MAGAEPQPRLIRASRDAEEVARDWLRYWGHADARLTARGPDGGIDVQAAEVVAQVKAEVKPVGRPVVQSLAGVAAAEAKIGVFFALGGYTAEALAWASQAKVAAFSFDLSGRPEPLNGPARTLAAGQASSSELEPEQVPDPVPLAGPWAQPLPRQNLAVRPLRPGDRASPRRLAATLEKLCLRRFKTVAGVFDGLWTPNQRYLWSVRLAYDADGMVGGTLQVFHLALPDWRHGRLPLPLPPHMVATDFGVDLHPGWAAEPSGRSAELDALRLLRAELLAEQEAVGRPLLVGYADRPWQETLLQLVADLDAVLTTLGCELSSTTLELPDVDAATAALERPRALDDLWREEQELSQKEHERFLAEVMTPRVRYRVRLVNRPRTGTIAVVEEAVAKAFEVSLTEARRRIHTVPTELGVLNPAAASALMTDLQEAGAHVELSEVESAGRGPSPGHLPRRQGRGEDGRPP